jgi:hypothetical protein
MPPLFSLLVNRHHQQPSATEAARPRDDDHNGNPCRHSHQHCQRDNNNSGNSTAIIYSVTCLSFFQHSQIGRCKIQKSSRNYGVYFSLWWSFIDLQTTSSWQLSNTGWSRRSPFYDWKELAYNFKDVAWTSQCKTTYVHSVAIPLTLQRHALLSMVRLGTHFTHIPCTPIKARIHVCETAFRCETKRETVERLCWTLDMELVVKNLKTTYIKFTVKVTVFLYILLYIIIIQ